MKYPQMRLNASRGFHVAATTRERWEVTGPDRAERPGHTRAVMQGPGHCWVGLPPAGSSERPGLAQVPRTRHPVQLQVQASWGGGTQVVLPWVLLLCGLAGQVGWGRARGRGRGRSSQWCSSRDREGVLKARCRHSRVSKATQARRKPLWLEP